ncbi:MAG: DUF4388 domain-containing protein [Myxococcales bacterium]|nr:DUF4388 domain-containing protein [Myxococcales bacterium]
MATPQVLLIDDNQTFGQQVVAAFSEVGLPAVWAARAGDAIALLERMLTEASGPPASLLCVVDLVRPASGGRVFLGHLHGSLQALLVARGCQPTCLALVPVIGSFHDLPEGVEVQVKPIFPSQVVATGRRLLGLSPAVSGRPLSGAAMGPASGAAAASSPRVPTSSSPGLRLGGDAGRSSPVISDSTIQLDTVEELSDFGPSDTVLTPLVNPASLGLPGVPPPTSNMEELARSLSLGGSDPALVSVAAAMVGTADSVVTPDAESAPTKSSARPRTKPQFTALSPLPAPGAGDPSDMHTIPFSRTMPLPLAMPAAAASGPYAAFSVEPAAQDRAALRSAPMTSPQETATAEALRGDLGVIPLVDIVSLLARQRQTGRLRIVAPASDAAPSGDVRAALPKADEVDIEIFLRAGRVDFAQVVGLPALRLGSSILAVAALQGRDLDEASSPRAAATEPDDNLLGQRLVRSGLLRPDELRQALGRQCSEILRFAMGLVAGRFAFLPCRDVEFPRRARDSALGGALALDAEALALAGYRTLRDRLHALREHEEGAVYLSTVTGSGPLSRLGLSDAEVAVLMLCNGRLTAADLARESHLPLSDVLLALGRLQSLRLCRRRLPALLAS